MEPKIAARSQRYLSLALAFRPPEAEAPRDVLLAYTRLFLGPGRPVAHPYESVHVEGHLLGEAAAQVVRCYAEAGLEVSAADRELPDHVSLELAFMAHLAAQEKADPDQETVWRDRQRRFLHEHLVRWLPQFCEKIECSEAHPYYSEAAQAAKELVEEDMARLKSPLPDAETRPLADSPEHKLVPRKRSVQHPDMRLAVDLSLCTLCTLCTDNCRPGALTVVCTLTTLSLAFDRTSCNGCRACLRQCPEDAITIDRGPALLVPLSMDKSLVISASRVVCPQCHRPHIAEPWLDRLAERLGGGECARRSLSLCLRCKANSGDGLHLGFGPSYESLSNA